IVDQIELIDVSVVDRLAARRAVDARSATVWAIPGSLYGPCLSALGQLSRVATGRYLDKRRQVLAVPAREHCHAVTPLEMRRDPFDSNLAMALASICRMRSRVTPCCTPISSRVSVTPVPMPKRRQMTSRSRSDKVSSSSLTAMAS